MSQDLENQNETEMTNANNPDNPASIHMELEKENESMGIGARTCLLLKPFRNLKVDRENKTLSVTIIPESIRTYFYLSFYIFVLLAITITLGSKNKEQRVALQNDNLIIEYFGANNICIYWDDPPFSFMAAFLFLPVITILLVYLVFDGIRVYFNYTTGHFGKGFYKVYVGFSLFTGIGIAFFIQSFATQPDQNMPMHAGPFLFLTFGLWTMAFCHFLYFLKMGIIKRGHPWYWVGMIYCVAMAITVVVKSALDLPNAFGAKTYVGHDWIAKTSGANDKFFMVIVTIMPLAIYWMFAPKLDHIQVTLKCVHAVDPTK